MKCDVSVRLRPRGESGFTLPELLITITILGIVMLSLSAAFIAVVKTNQGTHDRLGQSHDAQLVANYLVQDAQSADGTGVSTTALCSATGTVALSLTWPAVDNTFASSTRSVSYTLSGPAGGQTLTRWTCGGSGGSSHSTVSHYVVSIGAPQCLNSGAWSSTCNAGSTEIRLHVSEAQGAANVYSYDLNASFRKSSGSPSAGVPSFGSMAMIVLGSSSGCLNFSGNGYLSLANSGEAAAVDCAGASVGHNGIGGNFYSPNTCSGCGTNWHSNTPPVPDPYALRSYPQPGVAIPSTCPGGILLPGTYTNVTVSGSCQFASGTFVITGTLTVNNNATVTSGPGGVLVSFTGSGNVLSVGNGNTSISLAALASTAWPEFSMILPRTNASTIDFNTASFNIGGLYAPMASLGGHGNASHIIGKLVIGAMPSGGTAVYTIG